MDINRLRVAVLGILCLFLSALGGGAALAAEGLIAKVGDVEVSEFDLAATVQRKMPMQVSFHGKIAPEKIEEIRRQALEDLIAQAYQVNWARENRVSVSEEELAAAVKPLLGRYPSEQAMREAVGDKVFGDFRALMFRKLLADKARTQAVDAKVAVDEAQVKAHYEENQARYFRPRQFRASHILIKVDPSASAEERQAREQRAAELLEQARGGADFYNLAYHNSDDRTRYVGGDLGYFHEGQVVPEFETVILAMEPGQISELVRTRFGFHIIRLVEVNEPRQLSYEEVRERIRERLEKEQQERLMDAWMAELRERYPLKRLDGAAPIRE
ncbi:peptidylprolyl isomerase [Geoalkalibacter sp.]|uniref:peptidylprolyl isomerase n=1 Tax=Geoalkalibacter sp. TaxID=3041440 RepID=UPI00272DE399|nr:peptidylprolyl isomerase [Geoalkalibacter sp.]